MQDTVKVALAILRKAIATSLGSSAQPEVVDKLLSDIEIKARRAGGVKTQEGYLKTEIKHYNKKTALSQTTKETCSNQNTFWWPWESERVKNFKGARGNRYWSWRDASG